MENKEGTGDSHTKETKVRGVSELACRGRQVQNFVPILHEGPFTPRGDILTLRDREPLQCNGGLRLEGV